ncbi:LysR substrate-binding domain-containing protein [Rhizobium sp. 1399]|uniref:LysR substrate-binding domain-containing protein n=1 Tax=Rhizobium sp. 1399 TaxID=2817758 RepID=UPI0028607D61|nr:LysR substrate-binding domain-containing protein [Rhizobium sp. 1399]MDR6671227.1 DNA-binding transcriptional LysR family regulator [Rhizobium sp. 1399]
MRHMPSLNALRAFEAAGRLGLMKLAAEELNVTHSAISRQIQHLEEVLGTPLFEGPKHAPKLTEAGRILIPGLSAAFDQIDATVRLVSDTQDGVLDVSCLGTFLMKWLIPRLHRFRSDHPSIDVRLSTADSPVDFSRESFDVAIRVGTGPWPDDCEVIPLFSERFGPVHAGNLPADGGSVMRLPRLSTQTRRSAWVDWTRLSGIKAGAESGTEFEHFYFMLEAAVGGLGMCIAPWPLVADDIKAGRLIAPFGFTESGQSYVALRRHRRNTKASTFCEWLRKAATEFDRESITDMDHFAAGAREMSSISLASK